MCVQKITEAQWLSQVRQLAKMFGWMTYHPFLSKWSERGWPDLALLKEYPDGRARLILAELKSPSGKLTVEQEKWIEALSKVEGIEVYVWRPDDFENVVEILRK